MASGTIHNNNWKLAGTSSDSSEEVTYPASAYELLIYARTGGDNNLSFSSLYTVDFLQTCGITNIFIGGYWAGNSDHGVVNVNHTPATRKISFRNCQYGNNQNAGTFYIYYR